MKFESSELYLSVSVAGDHRSEVEMLGSTHLRPYASICAAIHYADGKLRPEERLIAAIRPGQERQTIRPCTRCLLSFIVEIGNAQNETVGACEFRRSALIDYVDAAAARLLARREDEAAPVLPTGSASKTMAINYCLHLTEGQPVAPKIKLPPIREVSLDTLIRGAEGVRAPMTVDSSRPRPLASFIWRSVYEELESLAALGEARGVEEGCLLDGEVLFDPQQRQFARLFNECVPAVGAEKKAASIRIHSDVWAHYNRTRSGRGILLAEGHSHPSLLLAEGDTRTGIFLSLPDQDIHRQFFWQFFQSTVILSKPQGQDFQLGVWGWYNGFIIREQEIYILDDPLTTREP